MLGMAATSMIKETRRAGAMAQLVGSGISSTPQQHRESKVSASRGAQELLSISTYMRGGRVSRGNRRGSLKRFRGRMGGVQRRPN